MPRSSVNGSLNCQDLMLTYSLTRCQLKPQKPLPAGNGKAACSKPGVSFLLTLKLSGGALRFEQGLMKNLHLLEHLSNQFRFFSRQVLGF